MPKHRRISSAIHLLLANGYQLTAPPVGWKPPTPDLPHTNTDAAALDKATGIHIATMLAGKGA